MFPAWLDIVSWLSLIVGLACAAFIAADVARRPQKMAIMNVVWPVTATFASVGVLALYLRWGRASRSGGASPHADNAGDPPFSVMVAKGALHCGSGCALGDIAAEWLAFAFPAVAVAFGWTSIFDEKTFAVWVLDFAFAFVLGIVFQYFAIVPMRKLAPLPGIVAAVKADTLSLAAWQVGMYGFMALAQWAIYPHAFGIRAEVNTPEFWLAMQIAMLAGFATSYPVNAWLIKAGLKEKM